MVVICDACLQSIEQEVGSLAESEESGKLTLGDEQAAAGGIQEQIDALKSLFGL
jgi:hypothetical protein